MTDTQRFSVVTGAFGYTGRYIAHRLLDRGDRVRTLTRNPASRSPFGDQVEARPLDFSDFAGMVASLQGADTLYNTYWVRYASGGVTHDIAVQNSRALLNAAVESGVRRVVQISITKAASDSPLPYFRGKAQVENAVRESGLSYAIVRPAMVFGPGDVLVNNIAWFLRRFPVFPIPGNGTYRVQPVFVQDVASLAVELADEDANVEVDAVGPESFSYKEMVTLIRNAAGGRARLVHVPAGIVHAMARLGGLMVKDVVLTREEVDGLMAGLLVSSGPPTAGTRFTEWLEAEGATLGNRYASELARHYR